MKRKKMAKAKLIIIEGLDGSGKSTQTALLEDYFKEKNISYKKLKFPDYDSPSSALVKMYLAGDFGKNADDVNPYAASAFYAVDRYASYKMKWKSDYEEKSVILADRYVTSNSIYQMEKISEDKRKDFLDWSEDFEYNKMGIPRPELVIYLDMPIEISQRLMTSRYEGDENKKDVHESNVTFLKRCRKSALFAAKYGNWEVVSCSDGDKPLPVDTIHNKIINIVERKLNNA